MRSLKGLSVALTILFALVALVDVGAAVARNNRAGLLDDIAASTFGLGVTEQEITDADTAVQGFGGVHLLLAIAIVVVLMIWQFRHAKNAELLGTTGGLGAGWAIGGWFIPIGNLVLPAVQMFQSSKASDVSARRHGGQPKGAGVVIAWAIAFALGGVLLASSGALVSSDDEGNIIIDDVQDIEDAASSDRTAGAGYAVLVVAAGLGAAMVRTLTNRQTNAYAATGAAAPAAASPPPPPATPPPLPSPPGTPTPPPPPL